MRAPLSSAAALLLRSLLARTGLDQDRVNVGKVRSVDWQSLTFTGERHEIFLRLLGPQANAAQARLRAGLGEVEWQLAGHIVADIVIVGEQQHDDGSITILIEALTLHDAP